MPAAFGVLESGLLFPVYHRGGYMRPIQTRLGGLDYRSRTEAEWAEVLRAHKIAFDYEPVKFDFRLVAPSDWGPLVYIPDFWLPDLKLWLEVKPHLPNLQEYRKAALLAECTGCGVLVTAGGTGNHEMLFVKNARLAPQMVSTIGVPPYEQAPLKLDIEVLTNTTFLHKDLRPFAEAMIDMIQGATDAYGGAKERRRRVLFLPADADPHADCYCDPAYLRSIPCRSCSGPMRSLLTEESGANLHALDSPRKRVTHLAEI